jgi:putative solute:sodium symporter small subunit|tara:strand:+ start:752 stop:1027 length:276 start_codon:yes stop_codon:yes gene_type:complete
MENETNLKERRKAYWRANLRILAILMSIWFVVSFGCGILFVEPLNQIKLGGFKFGFWMAQQGSIYVFVALIFVYVRQMNKLDREFNFQDSE